MESQLAKKANAGALATISLRGDSKKRRGGDKTR